MSKSLYFEAIMNNGSKKTYSVQEAMSSVSRSVAESAFNKAIEKEFFKIGSVKPISINKIYLQEIVRTELDP